MGIFDRLFGANKSYNRNRPDILFGRYSDSYKTEEQYDAWDQATTLFSKEEFLEAYKKLLWYLRDEAADNVKWWDEKGGVRFELLQGSKKITGFASPLKVIAEAKIARATNLQGDFMRRLLEKNYDLQYCHFALDNDHNLIIRFNTYTLDGSPYKLYYALKELATNADKQDDLLIDEFRELEAIDISHLEELSPALKEVKYHFLSEEINKVFDYLQRAGLEDGQYTGGVAYCLLNLCYKLDYLIKPEGFMMETLERINRKYFATDSSVTSEDKNQGLKKELKDLIDRPRADFYKEMYHGISTFGITMPVNHDRVVNFIDGELNNMDWYFQNGYLEVACAVPGYIIGYCLFNYALPKPDRDLFHLYYEIAESGYFKKLGFTPQYYDFSKPGFNKKAIKTAIKAIVDSNRKQFPNFNPAISELRYDSLSHFSKSYLMMVRQLDLVKVVA